MRPELFDNPRSLCERLATESLRRKRLAELRGTPAASLEPGHIDALELIKLARDAGVGVVYDIGANIGTFSQLAKSVPHVILHPIAVGSDNKEASLHVTEYTDDEAFGVNTPTGEDLTQTNVLFMRRA